MSPKFRSGALAAAVLLLAACGGGRADAPRVLVLGIDGMDPVLLRRFMDKGVMPNFARLAAKGSFHALRTVTPPQSPVAWATVITGMDPGGHGIFDFIHRDPQTMLPYFSTSQVEEPKKTWTLGSWVIPLDAGRVVQLRGGEAFWQVLDRHGVPATVLKMPSNFPPVETRGRTLSGMGTPDVRGTYGIFQYYTDDFMVHEGSVSGGRIHRVALRDGSAEARLPGPRNTLRVGKPETEVPFQIHVDPHRDVARVDIAGERILLTPGEWSRWVRVDYTLIPWLRSVHGIVRFHLIQTHPRLRLYASPVNLDPLSPALPISTPDDFSARLAREIGLYYTQGMPEETKALSAGILQDDGFMSQAQVILGEEDAMLDYGLERFHSGLLFVYFSLVDQVCHMMWRAMDPNHPLWTPELGRAHGDAIEWTYRSMDDMLGRALDSIGPDVTLLVMSDHGFGPFNREVNLNTWLLDEGYLVLTDPALESRTQFFDHVDWSRTRAYALGLNGIYLNLQGRERSGIVRPGREAEELLDEISRKLLALRDPDSDRTVAARVYRSSEIYHGPHVKEAPDLLVGYRRGWRTSDDSALGSLSRPVIRDRRDAWSGTHLNETASVPGVLLSNRKIEATDPGLEDVAPTVLSLYGIEPGPGMIGRAFLGPAAKAPR